MLTASTSHTTFGGRHGAILAGCGAKAYRSRWGRRRRPRSAVADADRARPRGFATAPISCSARTRRILPTPRVSDSKQPCHIPAECTRCRLRPSAVQPSQSTRGVAGAVRPFLPANAFAISRRLAGVFAERPHEAIAEAIPDGGLADRRDPQPHARLRPPPSRCRTSRFAADQSPPRRRRLLSHCAQIAAIPTWPTTGSTCTRRLRPRPFDARDLAELAAPRPPRRPCLPVDAFQCVRTAVARVPLRYSHLATLARSPRIRFTDELRAARQRTRRARLQAYDAAPTPSRAGTPLALPGTSRH